MRKKVVVLAMLCAFLGSAAFTVFSGAATPGCNRCKKQGCPQGYCYVDCVGCCYNHPTLGTVCFR